MKTHHKTHTAASLDRVIYHKLFDAGFERGKRCVEWISSFAPFHMGIEGHNCSLKKATPNCFLVGVMGGHHMEQLSSCGPGSSLRYVEREAAEQKGGVHSSTHNFVDKAHIVLETPFFETANFEVF